MSNSNLVNHLDARRNLRMPAMSIAMQDTCALMAIATKPAAVAYERTEATWVHTPKFGPDHHSQRWRQAS